MIVHCTHIAGIIAGDSKEDVSDKKTMRERERGRRAYMTLFYNRTFMALLQRLH